MRDAVRRALVAAGAYLGLAPWAAAQNCPAEYAGVTVTVVEDAHDGRHQICAEQLVRVDANSDLLIEFAVPPPAESVATSPEWRRLATLLERVRDLEREIARLNAAPQPSDSAGVEELHRQARAADERVEALLDDLDALGLSPRESRTVLAGSFPGGTGDRRRPYANLNLWLDGELRRLTSQAEAFAAGKERLVVQVEAFRDPRGGKRSALHVEHYDDLPLGELQTIDRYGLRLTPAERASWEASVAFNQSVAEAIREIHVNRQLVDTRIRDRLRDLGERLQQLRAELASGPDAWAAALPARIQQIEARAAQSPSESSQAALKGLATELSALRQDYTNIHSALGVVSDIADRLRAASGGDLRQALFQTDGIVHQLGRLDTTVAASLQAAAKWPGRVRAIEEHLQALRGDLPTGLSAEVLSVEVSSFFTALSSDLPATVRAVQAATALLDASRPPIEAEGTLPAGTGKVLPRGLDDLPPGRIELGRAGWVPGDRVLVSVSFRERRPEGEAAAETRSHEFSYRGEAVLTGLHRELSSALIFARALHDGEAQRWKPNVAALVGWHYYKRDPRSFGGKLWNWLNPGLGIHLASLDQDEDNFEFGVGGNLTVWNGLLSTAFGWNLSRTNGEYVFLAIDLFETLNRARR